MMAGKARLFDDKESLDDIMEAAHPRTQKQLGRQVRGFKDSVWKKNCLEIVTQGNLAKFRQNLDLRHKLLSTGNRIIAEASPKDRIWGIGLHARDKNCQDQSKWRGSNLLGVALMKVRSIIREDDLTSKASAEINEADVEADKKLIDSCTKRPDTSDEVKKETTDKVAGEDESEGKSSISASEKRSKRLKKIGKRSRRPGSKGRRRKNTKITDWM